MCFRWRGCIAVLIMFNLQANAGGVNDESQETSIRKDYLDILTQNFHESGWMSTDYFRSDNHLDGHSNFLGATVDLKVSALLGDSLKGKVEFRATDPSIVDHGVAASSLIEGYLDYQLDQVRIKLGKQIIPWGRADGINPTDNITPHDYVVLLPFEEDQRYGATALNIEKTLNDEMTLSFITTPYFEPTKIPLPLGQVNFVNQIPNSNLEYGIRLNKAGGQVDWSISYFHGHSLFPDLRPIGNAMDTPTIALTYPDMDVLGADFAFNLGRFGIRGEMAYHRMRDENLNDPLSRNSYWYYVIGADRTYDDNLGINFQLYERYVQNYTNPDTEQFPIDPELVVIDAIIGGQQDKRTFGFTTRVSKSWLNDSFKAELLALVNDTRRDYYLRPLLSYNATDSVKVSIGANIYRGPEQSFFGRIREDSGIFCEMRYSF